MQRPKVDLAVLQSVEFFKGALHMLWVPNCILDVCIADQMITEAMHHRVTAQWKSRVGTSPLGSADKFDKVVASSRVSKNPARWIRFLLMLCGDIHPNPGPRPPRGPMDLTVGFTAQTSEIR